MTTQSYAPDRRQTVSRLLRNAALLLIAANTLGGVGAPHAARADSLLMMLPETTVSPDATLDVPLTVHGFVLPKGNAAAIAGFDFDISWDAAIAELVAVTAAAPTTDWLVADNVEPGRVRISMAGLQTIAPPATGMQVLSLRFHVVGNSGETPLRLMQQRAFDSERQPIASVAIDGSLIITPVPAQVWTIGRLRAQFAAR